MKILGVHVYGYGKLENIEIGNLSSDLQVFYGQNEAGKSTLMSFIHSILFGFPTKHQQDQRYIPKTGVKYGGKLVIDTEQFGTIMIERLPGKAIGDVTVYMPDGTVCGEEFLSELFRGMDKSLYQNIYSFNIHGLQGVSNLRSEDVGRFLFSSGVVGTDALLNLENKLGKEMDSLFKPNGKKPLLNAKLIDLKEEHSTITKWQEKNNEYQILLEKMHLLEKKLGELDTQKDSLQEVVKEAERLQTVQPLLAEYETLDRQLQQLPVYAPFPEDGLKRLEQLQAQLKPYEAQISALRSQNEEWRKIIESIQIELAYLENEQMINKLSTDKNLYEEKKYRLESLQTELLQVKEEINQLESRLHVHMSDEEILALDTSISAKDLFSEIVTEVERSKQRKLLLDESFARAKESLENNEMRLSELQKQALSKEERNAYEKASKFEEKQADLEKKKGYIEEEINRIDQKIKGAARRETNHKGKIQLLLVSIGIVLVGAAFFAYLRNDWIILGVFVLLLLGIVPIGRLFASHSASDVINELKVDRNDLIAKLHQIQDELVKWNTRDFHDASIKILRDQQIKQEIEVEKASLALNERTYEKVVGSFEDWEREKFLLEEKATTCKLKYGIPSTISNERLLDAFQLLESIKEKVQRKLKLEGQLKTYQDEVVAFQGRVNDISERFNLTYQEYGQAIDQLANNLLEEKKKNESILQYERKINDATDGIKKVEHEVHHIKTDYENLYKIAEVTNEEAYRAKGQANEAARVLKERMALLDAQLQRYNEFISKCNLEEDYQAVIEIGLSDIRQVALAEKELQLQLSDSKHRIQELEEGGTYADELQSFEVKKSLAKEYAKRWAVHAVAKDILTKTIDQYRRVRLPMVITKAESYFSILTEGNYTRIYSDHETGGFLVEGVDGIRYKPNELSQATAEQLYIALRFSLAQAMHPHDSFPFMIDDSFVNFDSQRLSQAVTLIKELSKENQVLLFTCHPHVVESFKALDPIYLGERVSGIPSNI